MTSLKTKYKHVISLGSFCSTAMEIERYGFRDSSYPFDWVLSKSMKCVMELINTHFDRYVSYEMYQLQTAKYTYINKEHNIWFVHDFNEWDSFESQFESVREKYSRRIERFYAAIKEPTVFLRYIETEEEMSYIDTNYPVIVADLKAFNVENRIIFIVNSNILDKEQKKDYEIYSVLKDDNDTVARQFFDQLPELQNLLADRFYSTEVIDSNKKFFHKKQKLKRQRNRKKMFVKTLNILQGKKEYQHDKKLDV